jgi:HSP20 family molecular chaperone IbpA
MSKKTVVKVISVTSVGPEVEAMEQLIRERAYQRFIERGSEYRDPLEDWISAEAALVSRPAMNLTRDDKAIIAELDIPDVSPEQIELKADEKRVLVRASAPQKQQDSQESASPQLFCVVEFPVEIDREGIRAEYRQGNLRIFASSRVASSELQMAVGESR